MRLITLKEYAKEHMCSLMTAHNRLNKGRLCLAWIKITCRGHRQYMVLEGVHDYGTVFEWLKTQGPEAIAQQEAITQFIKERVNGKYKAKKPKEDSKEQGKADGHDGQAIQTA